MTSRPPPPTPPHKGEGCPLLRSSPKIHFVFSAHANSPCTNQRGGGGLASVKAFAVEPEAVAGLVLDEVVVARRLVRATAPPFAGDALRSLGAGRRSCITPRQRKRRGGPSGTSAMTSAGSARGSSSRGRGRSFRPALGQGAGTSPVAAHAASARSGMMACERLEPSHAARAKPLPEAIDQRRAALCVVAIGKRGQGRSGPAPCVRRR